MQIKIESDINDQKWELYPEVINHTYLEKLLYNTIAYSKYSDVFDEVELSVTFTDNKEITAINKEWRGKDKPTNIISIQVEEFSDATKKQYVFLGNLILSIDKIEEEVQQDKKIFVNHCTHLIIHGILHLMGYNHIVDSESAIMESAEVEILKSFNIPSPY